MSTQTGIAQVQLLNRVLASKDITILAGLSKDHFFVYPDEYKFIVSHYKEYGVVPDIETFIDHFPDFQRLEVSESVDYLIKKLIDDLFYKKMIPITSDFNHEAVYGDIVSATQTLTSKSTEVLSDLTISTQDITDLSKNFQAWIQPDTSGILPSGYEELDDLIGGIRKRGGLTIVQGATGQGKSWVLIWMMHYMAYKGKNVIFYSDEMSKEEITKRLWAIHIKRPMEFFDLPHKDLTYDISGKIVLLSRSDISGDVIDGLSNFALAHSADAIIIDGIKYMRDAKSDKKGYEQMEDACIRLMQESQRRDCAMIAAAQSNRGAEVSGSGKGTIAGSYDMLGIATAVIALNRENDDFILSVEKSRHSSDGKKFVYTFDWNTSNFSYKGTKESDDLSDVPDASSLIRKTFKRDTYVCDVHSRKDSESYVEFTFDQVRNGEADKYTEELRAWDEGRSRYTDYMNVNKLKRWIDKHVPVF